MVEPLTREERIAILEAHARPGLIRGTTLKQYEETLRQTEGTLAAFAGVVYALAGGTNESAINAVYAWYRTSANDEAKHGDEGRQMHEYYHGIAKALKGVLDTLE